LPADAKRLDVAISQYLRHRDRTVEPFTVRSDRSVLEIHLLGAPNVVTTDDVTTAVLQDVFDRLAEHYERSTLRRFRIVMGAFFTWAGRKGDANPARDVVVRELEDVDAYAWADEELAELRRVADRIDAGTLEVDHPKGDGARGFRPPDSYRLCLEAGLGSGGRARELWALEWPRFNEARRSVRFNCQVDERGTGVKPLKGKQNRTALVLRSWWEFCARRVVPVRGRLLTPRPGLDMPVYYAEDWMAQLYRTAGLFEARRGWHTLRHTYSRVFLEAGGSLDELQRSLGHKSIRTTQDTYDHFTDDAAVESARRRIYGDAGGARVLRA
jgi:integrase